MTDMFRMLARRSIRDRIYTNVMVSLDCTNGGVLETVGQLPDGRFVGVWQIREVQHQEWPRDRDTNLLNGEAIESHVSCFALNSPTNPVSERVDLLDHLDGFSSSDKP